MNDYQLFKFQSEGIGYASSARDNGYGFKCKPYHCIIGDEMGLGKTAQGLEILKPLIKRDLRFLFIVPGATTIQWQKNYDRWILDLEPDDFGTESLFILPSSKSLIPRSGSCVISHAMLGSTEMIKRLAAADFDGILIDEIHKFGSRETKRIKHLNALISMSPGNCAIARIGLTGTPVRNYASEIFNLANFVGMPTAHKFPQFASKYLTYDFKALYNPRQFHDDFKPYYIRRTCDEVQKDLPTRRRTKLYTEITDPMLRVAYNHQLDVLTNFVRNSEKIDSQSLLGYLIRLRHITGIAKAKEPAIIEPIRDYLTDENGKNGNKVVIGLHHKFVSDRLSKSLDEFTTFKITGALDAEGKEKEKLAFIAAQNPAILHLSIKAGGEGIDGLQTTCRKAYVFERQWNGADEEQFEKRIHRTGQLHPVEIEYTIAVGTVDEFFDEMVEYKRKITGNVKDPNYEVDGKFMRDLAERVISSRLSSNMTYDASKYSDSSKLTKEDEVFLSEINAGFLDGSDAVTRREAI